ncbi:GYDIA family GHMP kinase [Maribacter algicola]|uniref:GYDIA family GHMP kinase n=1 Tax=Meishania litoralis TaxID=3434685 RepID=A0ACC7LJU9_9FLAO
MTKNFYSNGKLLLSGEYAILDGAKGLAVPTKFGQSLNVTEEDSAMLHWKSIDEKGNIWFEGRYELLSFAEVSSSDAKISKTLIAILRQAKGLNPKFLVEPGGLRVETKLTFSQNWGLGTSSTLINNIAQWSGVDPYALLAKTFGGSGYDIACAQNDSPVLFWLEDSRPKTKVVHYDPPFKDRLFFIHLNKKQNSREGIADYRKKHFDQIELINSLSDVSLQLLKCKKLNLFEELISKHEDLLSRALNLKPVGEKLFSDYSGAIKSLGAWGGDFILATGDNRTPDYFKEKGYETIIPYSQMVLS